VPHRLQIYGLQIHLYLLKWAATKPLAAMPTNFRSLKMRSTVEAAVEWKQRKSKGRNELQAFVSGRYAQHAFIYQPQMAADAPQ